MLNTFDILNQLNISPELDEDKKTEIVSKVLSEYKIDDDSRSNWVENYTKWMKLAMQVKEDKNVPWPNAANIKYPLLTIASIQFSARAYSLLIGTRTKLVKSNYYGFDSTGEKKKACDRVSRHMSYQIRYKNPNWSEEMDKGLLVLPIIGCFFKKTYWDSDKGSFCSDLVLPRVLVVNWNTQSLEKATRISHILYMSKNDIVSRILKGEYENPYEIDENKNYKIDNNRFHYNSNSDSYISDTTNQVNDDNSGLEDDTSRPITLIEQHRRLDLDGDGYEEPYIVTVDKDNEKLLRIVANYNQSTIKTTKEGKIYRIDQLNYFTKYSFIPNPDGGFYDIGFGMLLGSVNETVNTLINQLLDAGTLNNMSTGFISKNLNISGGKVTFAPGKWNFINSTYDDLRKAILQLPTKEPSVVLLNLLELLIGICRDMTTIQDINVGKTPGQNTPATTTMAAVEEGRKLFNSIYERIHSSLEKEYSLMYSLNRDYLEGDEEFFDIDYNETNPDGSSVVSEDDYKKYNMKIIPTADPNASSEMQRQATAEKIISLVGTGKINPDEAIKYQLEAMNIDDWRRFINTEPPQPPVDLVKHEKEMELRNREWNLKERELNLKEAESPHKIEEIVSKTILNMIKGKTEEGKLNSEEIKQAMELLDKISQDSRTDEELELRHKELDNKREIEENKINSMISNGEE